MPLVRPAELPGLEFWLTPPADVAGKIAEATIRESGPARLMGVVPTEGLYVIACLHAQPAFVFSAEKIRQRRAAESGILQFAEPHDWNFVFDGTGFALVAICRPENPRPSDDPPDEGVLLRLGNESAAAPAFSLYWNRTEGRPEACLNGGGRTAVSALPGSQRDGEWKTVTVVSRQGVLSIAVDDQLGEANQIGGDVSRWAEARLHLEIGGTKQDAHTLFSGALAALLLYRGELSDREQEAIRGSLRAKYRL